MSVGSTLRPTNTKGNKMPTLTHSEFADRIYNKKGAYFATIVAETVPAMNKTCRTEDGEKVENEYHGGVTKIARVNGTIGAIYENGVLKRRTAEGNMEPWSAEARKWGERVLREDGGVTGLVEYKKEGEDQPRRYLEVFVNKSIEHEYRFNGEVIDGDVLHPFFPKRKEGSRQGLDKPIIVRDYSLENIVQVTMDGVTYDVVADEAALVA